MGYSEEAKKPRSTKITLVTIESVERVKLFTANGTDWDRQVNFFVVDCKENGVSLGSDFSFNPLTNTLKIIGGANPKTRNIAVVYRHFFSNTPIKMPYDFNEGEEVEWDSRVVSIGSIGQQLDNENTGIVLETSSSVDLINTDGFFDDVFDTHIWENQSIKFYSTFPNILPSERVQLFEGVIETKNFNDQRVTFRVKDFVFKLKNHVDLGLFSESDGTLLPSMLGTAKRRIYGQADFVQCVSTTATLDGYYIGTISGALGGLAITGAFTVFLADCSPDDEIFFSVNDIEYKVSVEMVDSNTQITIGKELEVSIPLGTAARCKPRTPYRVMNRNWMIAGHKLRAPLEEILFVSSANTFIVNDTSELFAGDEIVINGFQTIVRRISGNKVVTATNVVPTPAEGDFILKRPIKKAFLGTRELVYQRDYVEVNTASSCILSLTDLAEFNVADQRLVGVNLTFTNGSRTISTSSTVDLRTIMKPRDWIRSTNVSRTTWYELVEVREQYVVTRTPVSVSGGPYTEGAYYKSVEVVDENSLVTVNCLGMEYDFQWMKTASDSVRHLILNDAQFSQVNEEKFAKAKADCNFIMSVIIPETLGESSPMIRDVITKINNSVFGSLYGDSSQNISYSILNSTKPETSEIIRDDDIISFTIETNQKIVNKIICNYRPYVDIYSQADTFKTVTFNSGFVDDMIGIKSVHERTLYIYEDDKALIIAQRLALFNSLSTSTVKLKAKLNLSRVVVNDKLYLELNRLYSRFGGLDQRKLGTVTSVKLDGLNSEIGLTDLGNIYNRVPSIAPDSTLEYLSANGDDKLRWAFILDNDTLTPNPDSEEGLGNFIIG